MEAKGYNRRRNERINKVLWYLGGFILIKCSIDDGSREDLTVAGLLKSCNIPATFYIPVNCELTKKEIFELSRDFEIGSHTVNHKHLTKLDKEERQFEIVESKKMLEDIVKKPVTRFCFPRGYHNPEIDEEVRKAGYRHARTVDVFNLVNLGFLEKPTIHLSYPRKEYGDKPILDTAIEWFNRAKSMVAFDDESIVFHFWMHSKELTSQSTWNTFYDLLSYIKDNREKK